MDDILKCLKAAEELKKAVLDQQNLLKKLLIVFKNPKSNYRCCPMCETIFENEYDAFEEHVISHFEAVEIKTIETGTTLWIVDIIEKKIWQKIPDNQTSFTIMLHQAQWSGL